MSANFGPFFAIYAAIYLLSQDSFTTRLARRLEMPAGTNGSVTAMSGTSIRTRIYNSVRRFSGDLRGNIAPIFAIALLPMLGFVGAAVDYARVNAARSSMQAAMDSAVLMVSKDAAANPTMTSQQITDTAQQYFSALYHDADAFGVTVNAVYTPSTSSAPATIVATGQGTINTDFMKVVGFPQLNFGTSSTSTWGNSRMRVALVLDNTGSMSSNDKMTKLQSAAKDLIDSLSAFSKTDGDVYISIIPFAKDVNVGTSNVDAPWINWSEWLGEPPILDPAQGGSKPRGWDTVDVTAGKDCPFTKKDHGFTCMDRPATMKGARKADEIPSNGYICPSVDSGKKIAGKTGVFYNGCYTTVTTPGRTIDSGSGASCGSTSNCSCSGRGSNKVCSTPTTYSHLWRGDGTPATADAAPQPSATADNGGWRGCINDRDQDKDISNVAPSTATGSDGTPSTKFYAEQWTDCLPATITPMSDKWGDLKDQIDAMTPSGNTNQSIGLAWGWQSLSTTNGPIKAQEKDSTHIYQDYIVLLSDGLNTQNRWSTNDSDIDARQELLCQKVKDDNITIFTIQVNINSRDPTSKVLQDCAGSKTDKSISNFQMITDPDQTAGAFQNILTQISQLRIAK
jgi:Flp pilus assembly protein TadG